MSTTPISVTPPPAEDEFAYVNDPLASSQFLEMEKQEEPVQLPTTYKYAAKQCYPKKNPIMTPESRRKQYRDMAKNTRVELSVLVEEINKVNDSLSQLTRNYRDLVAHIQEMNDFYEYDVSSSSSEEEES